MLRLAKNDDVPLVVDLGRPQCATVDDTAIGAWTGRGRGLARSRWWFPWAVARQDGSGRISWMRWELVEDARILARKPNRTLPRIPAFLLDARIRKGTAVELEFQMIEVRRHSLRIASVSDALDAVLNTARQRRGVL